MVLRDHTAGDPMREEVQWTNLTLAEIAGHLVQHGTPVSVTVVRQLLNADLRGPKPTYNPGAQHTFSSRDAPDPCR